MGEVFSCLFAVNREMLHEYTLGARVFFLLAFLNGLKCWFGCRNFRQVLKLSGLATSFVIFLPTFGFVKGLCLVFFLFLRKEFML